MIREVLIRQQNYYFHSSFRHGAVRPKIYTKFCHQSRKALSSSTSKSFKSYPSDTKLCTASIQSFPLHIQQMIHSLQDFFNRNIVISINNDDGGLFELYDPITTAEMWKSVGNTNSKTTTKSTTLNNDEATITSKKSASVLVLFVLDDSNSAKKSNYELSIVFTRRSKHLSSHASEISFPGGHYDPSLDHTIIDTAIREAVEELYPTTINNHSIGIDSSNDDESSTLNEFCQNLFVLGCTTDVPSMRGIPVTSVLALYYNNNCNINKDNNTRTFTIDQVWTGNPSEVELVFTVPVSTLIQKQLDSSSSKERAAIIAVNDSNIASTSRKSRTNSKSTSSSPQYPTANGTIWGLTAYILRPIIEKMLIPHNDAETKVKATR